MYGPGIASHNGLVHELGATVLKVIPELGGDVDGLWIHSMRRYRMARLIARFITAQDGWARPFGDFNHRWLSALFGPIRPVKDFLNGVWLGHPTHSAATDIPIGTLLLTVVLDVIGQNAAADIALVATILFMLAAAATGAADYTDTDGEPRVRATVHATLMVIGLLLLLISLVLRAAGGTDRSLAVGISFVGFLIVTAGAYVGGDVVYLFGNMVNHHAFRGAGTKWIRLDTGDVADLSTLPEATPTKAKAGINDLVLVRVGETVHALHAVCAHAGGPLAQGTFADGCIECPWHGSRFRMSDGQFQRGPTVYDQPTYEIRAAEGGGYEVRRAS